MIGWKRKRHGTSVENEASERRMLTLFGQWKRPEGVLIHQWLVRAGGSGGYAVVETDDLAAVHEATQVFSGFNFSIEPVLDIDVALAASGAAIEWRDAAV